jgi:hypothetical protein
LFGLETMKLVGTWRLIEQKLAVISISNSISKEIFAYNRKVKQIVLFERPYNKSDFRTICQRANEGRLIYLRQHERFATNQNVKIERIVTNEVFDGIMRNMSRGGAFLESAATFQEHEVLKLTITLDMVAKSHVMYGEVVRMASDAFGKGRNGVGLRYISPEDLYNALLETSKK